MGESVISPSFLRLHEHREAPVIQALQQCHCGADRATEDVGVSVGELTADFLARARSLVLSLSRSLGDLLPPVLQPN